MTQNPSDISDQPTAVHPVHIVTGIPWKNMLLLVLILALLGCIGFLIYQNRLLIKQQVVRTGLPESMSPTPTPSTNDMAWKTRKNGIYSYEYPLGWHVAELWQENYADNGILIAMDPDPINTAPRGGPIATVSINVLNGNKNPDEILTKRINDFNGQNYSDIVKETINADIGTIYHFTGKIAGDYLKGEPMEQYLFTFNQNAADPYNQQVVIATLAYKTDAKLSAILKHIVLSFKKLTQSSLAVTPTPESTTKTYTDKEFGYTVSYSTNWEFRRTYGSDIPKNGTTDILSGIDLHRGGTTNSQGTVVVNVLSAHGLTDADTWITKYDLNYPKTASKETGNFNGNKTIIYRYRMEPNEEYETWYFIHGAYMYRVTFHEPSIISMGTRMIVTSLTVK